jgi:hypothetical protein
MSARAGSLIQSPDLFGLSGHPFTAKSVAYFAAKGCTKWTEGDAQKIPFRAWSGSIGANDVSFEILSNPKKK